MPDMVDGGRGKPLSSCPAAHVRIILHLPDPVGPEIGRLVHAAAIVSGRTILRDRDQAEPDLVTDLRMHKGSVPLIGYLGVVIRVTDIAAAVVSRSGLLGGQLF